MRVVRSGNVGEVDVLALDEPAPVRFDEFIALLVGEGPRAGGIACADRLEHRSQLDVEEIADFAEGVGMCAAHEAAAQDGDIELSRELSLIASAEGHLLHPLVTA